MGMPVQLIIGEQNIINNNIEVKDRKVGDYIGEQNQIDLFLKTMNLILNPL